MIGYIRLYRKLLESDVFKNEKCLKIWVWCLLRANHKDNNFILGRQKLSLKSGQFCMGSIKESEFLEIAKSTLWFWLEFLEKEKMLVIKKTNKYSIITIKNWEKYQTLGNKSESNEETNGKQIGTNNNDIRMNKNEKDIADKSATNDFKEIIEYYHTLVLNSEGIKPEIRAKDCAMVKSLLKRYPKDDMKKIIYSYLSSDKAKKLGIDLSIALSAHSINQWKLQK